MPYSGGRKKQKQSSFLQKQARIDFFRKPSGFEQQSGSAIINNPPD